MYGSPIYGADVSGSLTDQDVNVSILMKLSFVTVNEKVVHAIYVCTAFVTYIYICYCECTELTECRQIQVVVDIQQFVGKNSKLYYIFMCLWIYTGKYQHPCMVWKCSRMEL
jgi:hypothetical protein